jgi:tRNA pseudouridine13 synthase
VNADASSLERARAILTRLERCGFLNYFGEQRFGRAGDNLEHALGWLQRGAPVSGPRGRFLRKLYPSVVQAEIFNRYVTARLARGLDQLLRGEVVRLSGSASMFVVEDVDREGPRLQQRDIVPTGPLPGPKMKRAMGQAAELEAAVVAELGLGDEQRALLERLAPGTRRDVLVYPERLEVRLEDSRLVLEFFLPSGSYATEVLRELTAARTV